MKTWQFIVCGLLIASSLMLSVACKFIEFEILSWMAGQ